MSGDTADIFGTSPPTHATFPTWPFDNPGPMGAAVLDRWYIKHNGIFPAPGRILTYIDRRIWTEGDDFPKRLKIHGWDRISVHSTSRGRAIMKRVANSFTTEPEAEIEPAEPPSKRQVSLLHIPASQKQLAEFDAPFDPRILLQTDAGFWDNAAAEVVIADHIKSIRPIPFSLRMRASQYTPTITPLKRDRDGNPSRATGGLRRFAEIRDIAASFAPGLTLTTLVELVYDEHYRIRRWPSKASLTHTPTLATIAEDGEEDSSTVDSDALMATTTPLHQPILGSPTADTDPTTFKVSSSICDTVSISRISADLHAKDISGQSLEAVTTKIPADVSSFTFRAPILGQDSPTLRSSVNTVSSPCAYEQSTIISSPTKTEAAGVASPYIFEGSSGIELPSHHETRRKRSFNGARHVEKRSCATAKRRHSVEFVSSFAGTPQKRRQTIDLSFASLPSLAPPASEPALRELQPYGSIFSTAVTPRKNNTQNASSHQNETEPEETQTSHIQDDIEQHNVTEQNDTQQTSALHNDMKQDKKMSPLMPETQQAALPGDIDLRENLDIFGSQSPEFDRPAISKLAALARRFNQDPDAVAKVICVEEDGRFIARFKLPAKYASLFPNVKKLCDNADMSPQISSLPPADSPPSIENTIQSGSDAVVGSLLDGNTTSPLLSICEQATPSPVFNHTAFSEAPEVSDSPRLVITALEVQQSDSKLTEFTHIPFSGYEEQTEVNPAPAEDQVDSERAMLTSFLSRHRKNNEKGRKRRSGSSIGSTSAGSPIVLASPTKRRALGELDVNSPSPLKVKRKLEEDDAPEIRSEQAAEVPVQKKQRQSEDPTDENETKTLSPSKEAPESSPTKNRRSSRLRSRRNLTPSAMSANMSASSMIPVCLPGPANGSINDNTDGLINRAPRSEQGDVTSVTRTNTRKNKGNAEYPATVLAKMKEDPSGYRYRELKGLHEARENQAAAGMASTKAPKEVRWDDNLVRIQGDDDVQADKKPSPPIAKRTRAAKVAPVQGSTASAVATLAANAKGTKIAKPAGGKTSRRSGIPSLGMCANGTPARPRRTTRTTK